MAPTTTTIDPSGDDGGNGIDHLRALRAISNEQRALDEKLYFHVLQARAAKVSWEGIAAALGVSRQAVHRRFRGREAGNGARRA